MTKYAAFQMTVTDEAGNVVPSAVVTIRAHTSGQPLVSLYSDRAGTIAIGNPITADADGFFRCYMVGGAYQVVAALGAFSRQWNHVPVGTAAEYDARDLIFAFPMFLQASGKFSGSLALMPVDVPLAMDIESADLTGWYARVRTAPNADRVISLVKNGVEFGTVTFLSGTTDGVFAVAADVVLAPGDQVWAIMPAVADTVMADFSCVIIARR